MTGEMAGAAPFFFMAMDLRIECDRYRPSGAGTRNPRRKRIADMFWFPRHGAT
jgi:hypothetical protein